ncbi:TonB family protein [Ignatzschineria larvae DSM 13226]|uniref:TonB family protein n=1 Tax=Ignatzschineria larvae DSM 13226 TaxID=1111732 RepID=A0ABZ3BZU4_9GAMM|nr:TonB family protein [Ignatzschineria larvae]
MVIIALIASITLNGGVLWYIWRNAPILFTLSSSNAGAMQYHPEYLLVQMLTAEGADQAEAQGEKMVADADRSDEQHRSDKINKREKAKLEDQSLISTDNQELSTPQSQSDPAITMISTESDINNEDRVQVVKYEELLVTPDAENNQQSKQDQLSQALADQSRKEEKPITESATTAPLKPTSKSISKPTQSPAQSKNSGELKAGRREGSGDINSMSAAPVQGDPLADRLTGGIHRSIQGCYPEASKRRGEEGVVYIRLQRQGDRIVPQLEESSGFPRLDRCALESVSKAVQSLPATQIPAQGLRLKPIRFQLR